MNIMKNDIFVEFYKKNKDFQLFLDQMHKFIEEDYTLNELK